MMKFKIPLINRKLVVRFSTEPREEKLRKNLESYFENNLIEDVFEIKSFELLVERNCGQISPRVPMIEGKLLGGSYNSDLKEIGNKYRLDNLDFAGYCYHK